VKNIQSFLTTKFFDWTRDITALANPLIIVLVPFLFLGSTPLFYRLLWTLLINEVFCSLIKVIFPKKRPVEQNYDSVIEKIDAGSFPSIHTSRITLVYLTLFSMTNHLGMQIALLAVIVLVMISRVVLKKHYTTDVIGGFIIGLLLWMVLMKMYVW
jgi:undecaprenyl-diphosphatase